jgi:hypothetical protein
MPTLRDWDEHPIASALVSCKPYKMMKFVTTVEREDSLLKARASPNAMFNNVHFSILAAHEQGVVPLFQKEGATTWLVIRTF